MNPLAAIRHDQGFGWLVLGSVAVHALLLARTVGLPSAGGGQLVDIYSVQIIEAPVAPPAGQLELAPPSAPGLTLPETPPAAPRMQAPPPARLPAPLPPALPLAPPALAPPGPKAPMAVAPGAAAQEHPEELRLSASPALPRLPSSARTRPKAAPETQTGQAASPTPAQQEEAAESPPSSSMQQLREKVQSLNLQVEATPSRRASTEEAQTQSMISLRLYQNTVRERVQEAYTFPGSFPARLKARVRVIVDRSGKQRSVELIASSGNVRFDRQVCMAAARKAKLPPLPDAVEGDTLALNLICTP